MDTILATKGSLFVSASSVIPHLCLYDPMSDDLNIVTDSAGITCRYTPIEKLRPGDVVIIGWRTTVKRLECQAGRCRIVYEGDWIDQWNPIGTMIPVEVVPLV